MVSSLEELYRKSPHLKALHDRMHPRERRAAIRADLCFREWLRNLGVQYTS